MSRDRDGELRLGLPEMPFTEWAAAIVVRHSCRTYTGREVDPALLDRLEDACEGLRVPGVARVEVMRAVPDAVFTGVVGSYGRVLGSPSALLMIGREAGPAGQESVGYMGEAAILEATSLGLGTCWIAGFFDRPLASALLPLERGEKVWAVSPVGYAHVRARAGERMLKRMVSAHKRRPVEEIAPGFDPETWPAWAAEGARLAHAAPSAGNRQPWRLDLEADPTGVGVPPLAAEPTGQLVISEVKRRSEGIVPRRLDCGIAMLHFEVGARLMGAAGSWEILGAPQVARYRVAPAALS